MTVSNAPMTPYRIGGRRPRRHGVKLAEMPSRRRRGISPPIASRSATFWQQSSQLLGRCRSRRSGRTRDRMTARSILEAAPEVARCFSCARMSMRSTTHLTAKRTRFVRLERAGRRRGAKLCPAWCRRPRTSPRKKGLRQSQKAGLEIDQGLFVSAVLRSERSGRHLCHAMLLPRAEAQTLLPKFIKDGQHRISRRLDRAARQGRDRHLPTIRASSTPRTRPRSPAWRPASISRCSTHRSRSRCCAAARSSIRNTRTGACSAPASTSRISITAGFRSSGISMRDLGYVNKLYRGLALPDDAPPDEFGGQTIEKPWIAAVEAFAIGGHCQILLAVDYVLAEKTAFMTLPARKEGIIPGAANMRLPRAVGDRIARQAIQYERRLECDSPEGRLICDEIVEPGTHGCGDRARGRRAHQLRRGQRGVEPPRLPHHAGAARHVPQLFRGLCARAGVLPLQPGADRQSGDYWNAENRKPLRRISGSRHGAPRNDRGDERATSSTHPASRPSPSAARRSCRHRRRTARACRR